MKWSAIALLAALSSSFSAIFVACEELYLEKPCLLRLGSVDFEEEANTFWQCQLSREDSKALGFASQKTFDISGYEDWFSLHSSEIVSGVSMFSVKGAHLSGGKLLFPPGVKPLLQNPNLGIASPSYEGTKKVIVLRVEASDSECKPSEDDLNTAVFGSGKPTLKSQYAACSYNKLLFEPFTGKTTTEADVSNGVATIKVGTAFKDKHSKDAAAEVIDAAEKKLGKLDQFDYYMICLPHGVTGFGKHEGKTTWAGWGNIPGPNTVYNNDWIMDVTTQMHEVGHNLGLQHSSETKTWNYGGQETSQYDEYGDKSGTMCLSNKSHPLKCFNGPKSWELGWYRDRHIIFPAQFIDNKTLSKTFVGVADYGKLSEDNISDTLKDAAVLGKITGGTTDIYISFNRKTGMNANTYEGCNKVLLHTVDSIGISSLIAKLNEKDAHVVPNFYNGWDLMVSFNELRTTGPWEAFVAVGKAGGGTNEENLSCCEGGPDKESNRACWEDSYGDTCWDYETFTNFCRQYGDTQGVAGTLVGKTAYQGCCACECAAASTQSFQLSDGSDSIQGEAVV